MENVRLSVSPSAEDMILICAGDNARTKLSRKNNWDILVDVVDAQKDASVENCLLIDCAEEVEMLAKDSLVISDDGDAERCEQYGNLLGGSFVAVTKGDAMIFALYTGEKNYLAYQVRRNGMSQRARLFIALLQLYKKIPLHVVAFLHRSELKETFESVGDYYILRLECSGFFLKITLWKYGYELNCVYGDVDFGN
jgi:hypothetical protein